MIGDGVADTSTYGRARAMRRAMTPPEARLWANLRAGRLHGTKFRRQHPVGPYILDFYCAAAKLAIEVDGMVHACPEQARRDARRSAWLGFRGIVVLRVNACDVRDEIDGVLGTIHMAVQTRRSGG